MATMDKMFAQTVDGMANLGANTIAIAVVMCLIIPPLTPILIAGLIAYQVQIKAIDSSNRVAQRNKMVCLSPIMTTIGETVNGRALMHAMKFEQFFFNRQESFTNHWMKFNYFSSITLLWGAFMTNNIACIFSIASVLIVWDSRKDFDDIAMIGVALNYGFLMPYFLGFLAQQQLFLQMHFTAVERILDYDSDTLPQEPAWRLPTDPKKGTWPTNGKLEFKNVSMRYRKDLPFAIKDVNVTVDEGKHVGIIGRTGAGKTSFIVVLFRIVDANKGQILLDGKDLNKLGLHTVRKALGIIPQTPLLIPGSLAHNLDPFNKYNEEKLKEVLHLVNLPLKYLKNPASDLSVGEQQLMALARLLLRNGAEQPKIIVMDEPTANIDAQTDEKMQEIINSKFDGVTMLTIAHRLNTVIGSNYMMVMDKGKMVEYELPHTLLQNKNSFLSKMVASLGEESENALKSAAAQFAMA